LLAGLKIFLVTDMFDTEAIREQLRSMAKSIIDPNTVWLWLNAEETFLRNMALVANLLAARLKYAQKT
jgi:hypothetical protein